MAADPAVPIRESPRVRSQARVNVGLLLFAVGFLVLAAGALQRHAGELDWGGRGGPEKKMAREEDPAFFDRVTWGLIASGIALTGGGLAMAYVGASAPKRAGRLPR